MFDTLVGRVLPSGQWWPERGHVWSEMMFVIVLGDFLTFTDNNSQPNGRSKQSHGPTRYKFYNHSNSEAQCA